MYHRVRRKMYWYFTFIAILVLSAETTAKSIKAISDLNSQGDEDNLDNNIIDFDSAYEDRLINKFGITTWHSGDQFNKDSHRYTVVKEELDGINNKLAQIEEKQAKIVSELNRIEKPSTAKENASVTTETSFMPIELLSTTENSQVSFVEITEDPELTVIPLITTQKITPRIDIENITIPGSTFSGEISTNDYSADMTEHVVETTTDSSTTTTEVPSMTPTTAYPVDATTKSSQVVDRNTLDNINNRVVFKKNSTDNPTESETNSDTTEIIQTTTTNLTLHKKNTTSEDVVRLNGTETHIDLHMNSTKVTESVAHLVDSSEETDVPIFTELDVEDLEVPEDYYDAKDVVPTKPPATDTLSLIFGFAGSVVESMAERVVPKGLFDIFKRMQKQSEALEAEKLRSREENGGIGQFGRGILKTISSGLTRPFTQLMSGAKDKGSLDSDKGFVNSLASGVTSVASSVVDSFKNRVQAIYPGTLWCGDGHSAQARSSDLGLFFFTDTCCRQHDACKIYIRAGETKYGLTNTGLFTRSHCSCDVKFRDCLQKTSSLVSAQIGLTYFNVLGPQCFRKAHPIVKCLRRTRITGQRCEEYEVDYTKPKMWQWFDNETY